MFNTGSYYEYMLNRINQCCAILIPHAGGSASLGERVKASEIYSKFLDHIASQTLGNSLYRIS